MFKYYYLPFLSYHNGSSSSPLQENKFTRQIAPLSHGVSMLYSFDGVRILQPQTREAFPHRHLGTGVVCTNHPTPKRTSSLPVLLCFVISIKPVIDGCAKIRETDGRRFR